MGADARRGAANRLTSQKVLQAATPVIHRQTRYLQS